ncbi:cytochrome P450 [Nocardia brasiliensis]|uniref:cytochrome P450 n=1 Tax=Nocardia brasiliensis TaxID=37326 RepID=UPI00367202D7
MIESLPIESIADPRTYADGVPHAVFDHLREHQPVAWIEEPLLARGGVGGARVRWKGSGYWALTRHGDVAEASRRPTVFSSAAKGAFLVDPRTRADLERDRQLLVNMDDPQHVTLRKAINSAFSRKAVRHLHADIARHAHAVVARVLAAERFDAVADLAAELPLLVLAELLGMPPADRRLLYDWSNRLVGFDDPAFGGGDIQTYRDTFAEAYAYALRLAADRRRDPGDDIVSMLVHADIGGRPIREVEFCQLWVLLVVAGNETTRNLISGALLELARQPALLTEAADTARAVEELLRWVTPIMQFRRTATEDTELSGQLIRAGDKVVLYYISANRDRRVFDAPDRLRLARDPNPHLAFGVGPHFCLGAHLARLEAVTLFDELRPHLHRFELLGPATRLASNFTNGITSLPARFVAG